MADRMSDRKTNTPIIIGLSIIALILTVFAASVFSRNHSVSQVFVFLAYSLTTLSLITFLFLELNKPLRSPKERGQAIGKAFLVATIGALALELLTVYGSPKGDIFCLSDWSKKRLIVFFALSLTGYLALDFFRQKRARKQRENLFGCISIKRLVLALSLSAALALIPFVLISLSAGNATLAFFLFPFAIIFSISALANKPIKTNLPIEGLFLATALPFGLSIAICTPVTTGLSFDDQIHYSNSIDASYIFTSQKTDTDLHFSEIAVKRAQGEEVMPLANWTPEKIQQEQDELDAAYASDVAAGHVQEFHNEPIFTLSTLGYIPSAFGLWLARILGLGFCNSVILGRIFNLLAFALTFFIAIRVVPAKKTLFAIIGLIPSSLFFAANYSYDPWLISMTALGCALLFREMWSNKKHFSLRKIAPSLLVSSLGIAVKATYFPVLGLFLLMPQNKFRTKKQRATYYAIVIAVALLLLVSFALPFLFAGSSNTGDARGGDGVNPIGQVAFILGDPIGYGAMLAQYFASTYFSPSYAPSFLLNYAYLGQIGSGYSQTAWILIYGWIPFFTPLACALTDGSKLSAKTAGIGQSVWSATMFLFSLVLVATAMYVSFTPVGHDTVNGCQARYILPLLVPALACIFNNKHQPILADSATKMLFLGITIAELSACSFLLVIPKFIA